MQHFFTLTHCEIKPILYLTGQKKITKLETVMGTTNDKPEMNLVADIFNSSAYQSIVLAAKTVIIIKDIQWVVMPRKTKKVT